MKLIQDRTATVNGIRLHYVQSGRGEPVVLLHGLLNSTRAVATNFQTSIISGSGHSSAGENPTELSQKLLTFFA
jgi:hypothetical protein